MIRVTVCQTSHIDAFVVCSPGGCCPRRVRATAGVIGWLEACASNRWLSPTWLSEALDRSRDNARRPRG